MSCYIMFWSYGKPDEEKIETSPEEVKAVLEGVTIQRCKEFNGFDVPGYFLRVDTDDISYSILIGSEGRIFYYEKDLFVFDADGNPMVRRQYFRDDGSLYRLMVEKFGDAGLDTLEEE